MIQFLQHTEIDKKRWDICIDNSINGLIYAQSWYLDVVSPQWCALILNDYEAVMPLPVKRKWGIDYVFRPVFTQQLGIFSSNNITESLLAEFLNKIPFRYSALSINHYNSLLNLPLLTISNNNFELEPESEYNLLYKNFIENHRRNIAKSQKEGLEFKLQISINEIINFKKKHNEIFVSDHDLSILNNLVSKAQNHGLSINCGVYSSAGTLLAAVVLLHYKQRLTYLFSISSNEGKDKRAMFFLVSEIIKKHAGSNITLDFEGSNIPALAFFFEGFGSTNKIYKSLIINKLPLFLRLLKK